MRESVDVLIVGGGVAGVAAALAARESGAAVALIRRGPGATALSSGGWAGDAPPALLAALAGVGYALPAVSQPLPHPTGDVRRCERAAEPQAAAALAAEAVVVGIAGLPWFRARALSRLWSDAAGIALESRTISLPGTPPGGWSPIALARALETEPERLVAPLAGALAAAGTARAVLPAVLGVGGWSGVRRVLAEAGLEAGEALGVPPSLPGWRLDAALRRAAEAAGVRWFEGVAASAVVEGSRIVAVELLGARAVADRAGLRIAAAAHVLATGGFVGGGVVLDSQAREPVLGLPVHLAAMASAWAGDPLTATQLDPALPQPLLDAGIAADDAGRPTAPAGPDVPENVWVAGAVRVGRAAGSWALGTCAWQGWRAGAAAAAAAAGAGAAVR
jgi:glycerol-3-phosphate dehydrogenase subunit B